MSGSFIGFFDNTVSNNRITIPAKFKKKFSVAAKESVIVTIGFGNTHIAIFPLDYWTALADKLQNGNDIQKMALKSYLDYADDQKVETNGRIRLRQDLLDITGISKEIIIKGEGEYFSLWEPAIFVTEREKRRQELIASSKETDLLL